jgi:alkylation response protein AidB-like acyl-CoA dehydrogenase
MLMLTIGISGFETGRSHVDTGTAAQAGSASSTHPEFEDALTPDTLSALMRSTWTWDDRALRRDLSTLLVEIAAARGDIGDEAVARALRACGLATGARFVATVLGPHLVADVGSAFRSQFLSAASDPAVFDRSASSARVEVQARAMHYLRTISERVDYPDASSWLPTATADGADGLGRAMRGYGYALGATPLLGNVALAWQTLRALGADGSDYAGRVERGEIRATLAAAERSGSWDPALVRTTAQPDSDGWTLTGAKHFVPDAAGADVVLTVARSVAGPSLFAVDANAPGVAITELAGIDTTRQLFKIEFNGAPAELLGKEGRGGALMRQSIDLLMTALAGEQVGLIERSVDVLLRHAQDGSLEEALTQTALDHAASVSLWTQALEADAGVGAAAMAHIGCSTASLRVASLTAEVASESEEAAAILRRALSTSLLLGGPAVSHERLLERLGI